MPNLSNKFRSVFILGFCLTLVGCFYDNEEELYPTTTCETQSLSYSSNLVPLLTNNGCIGCHTSNNQSGGVRLDIHSEVKKHVDNGRLMGSINHESGFTAMPAGSTSKINDCSIQQIQAWIDDGALDN